MASNFPTMSIILGVIGMGIGALFYGLIGSIIGGLIGIGIGLWFNGYFDKKKEVDENDTNSS